MDNQHQKIAGYRDFNQDTVDKINAIKAAGAEIGKLIEELEKDPSVDIIHLQDGKKFIQTGFMLTIRSVAKPTTFV